MLSDDIEGYNGYFLQYFQHDKNDIGYFLQYFKHDKNDIGYFLQYFFHDKNDIIYMYNKNEMRSFISLVWKLQSCLLNEKN